METHDVTELAGQENEGNDVQMLVQGQSRVGYINFFSANSMAAAWAWMTRGRVVGCVNV